MNQKNIKIFMFPSSNRNNKYIELFRNSVEEASQNVEFLSVPKDFLFRIIPMLFSANLFRSKRIIHIHWPTVMYGSRFFVKSIFLLSVNFFLLLFLKYFLGFKIVWTVHNFHAHDYPHPGVDKVGQRGICWLSDALIVQQKITRENFQNKCPR